jgi:hypothetical protein
VSGSDLQYASADARDKFLAAIDSGDWQACMRLALGLTTCGNPLPGMACQQLDLPARSTYGCAARRVLALCQDSMTARPAAPGETANRPGASDARSPLERTAKPIAILQFGDEPAPLKS